MELALGILTIITGLIGIATALYKLFHRFGDYMTTQQERSDLEAQWRKDMMERMDDLSMDVLRLAVVNRDMPLQERLAAGTKYVERGGNGYIRAIVEQLEKEVKA